MPASTDHAHGARPGTRASPKAGTKASAKDEVYARIREQIISFGLKPGERWSEAQLAERFDVGLASIRSALPRLVQEGLLLNQRRRGHLVRPLTLKDMLQVYQMRALIEPEAAALAAGSVDVDRLAALDDDTPSPDRLAANRAFHMAIAEASGNELMAAWVGQLQDLAIRFQYLLSRYQVSREEWGHSHDRIIDALRRGEADQAREAMGDHIARGRELSLAQWIEIPQLRELKIEAP
jgi:DNA-binding GntR family transcriptional regulator